MTRPDRAFPLFLALIASPAAGFDLALPIGCQLGETCHIQNYFDHDPGAGTEDFACGPLGYDGHDGTDFALPSLAAMQAGVDVLAAAPGTVLGIRDGMADISIRDPAAPPLEGRDCGNGVLIDHGDGWQTQYCHMKSGSIAVRSGDRVDSGTRLGEVGLSGNTEFPHLHLSVRRNDAKIDPFDPGAAPGCGAAVAPLWAEPIPYQPGGFIALGFSTAVPEYEALQAGLPAEPIPSDAPALVLWAYYFGPRAGDLLELSVTGPDGGLFSEEVPLDRTQAQAFRAFGKRLRESLTPGRYEGLAILRRDGAEIDRATVTLDIPG